MPSHDPFKDPAFCDLGEEQMVDIPLDARCRAVKDLRKTVVELESENQTLGGAIIRSPKEHTVRPHPRRLNAIESAQPQPVVAGEPSACLPSARPSAHSWACPIPTFCARAFTLGSQRLQPTGILRVMTKPRCNFIARQVLY
jgi:hypothetical protein